MERNRKRGNLNSQLMAKKSRNAEEIYPDPKCDTISSNKIKQKDLDRFDLIVPFKKIRRHVN